MRHIHQEDREEGAHFPIEHGTVLHVPHPPKQGSIFLEARAQGKKQPSILLKKHGFSDGAFPGIRAKAAKARCRRHAGTEEALEERGQTRQSTPAGSGARTHVPEAL